MLFDISIVLGNSSASQSTGVDLYKILPIISPFIATLVAAIPVFMWKQRLETEFKLKRKETNIQMAIPTYEEANYLCHSLNAHICTLFALFSVDKIENVFNNFQEHIDKTYQGIDADYKKLDAISKNSKRPHIDKLIMRKVEAVISLVYDAIFKYESVKDKPVSTKVEYAIAEKATLNQCIELLDDIEERIAKELGND